MPSPLRSDNRPAAIAPIAAPMAKDAAGRPSSISLIPVRRPCAAYDARRDDARVAAERRSRNDGGRSFTNALARSGVSLRECAQFLVDGGHRWPQVGVLIKFLSCASARHDAGEFNIQDFSKS